MNSDDSNLAANAKLGLVNYLIASLFQQVKILLNGNLISSSPNIYEYRAMSQVLLGYDQGAKISNLNMVLYSKDTEIKMNLVAEDGANSGLKAR